MALSRREFVRRLGAGGAAVASTSAIIGYGREELLALGLDGQAQPARAEMAADAIRISSNENLRGPSAKVLDVLRRSGRSLREALDGLSAVPQRTINVRLEGASAKAIVEADGVRGALEGAQAAVQGRGRAFLRPSGTEPVVRVTVEADDALLMQDTLDRLAAAVREAAAA